MRLLFLMFVISACTSVGSTDRSRHNQLPDAGADNDAYPSGCAPDGGCGNPPVLLPDGGWATPDAGPLPPDAL